MMVAAVHSFRAVIHPHDIDTTDRPGRQEQTAVRERDRLSVSQLVWWPAISSIYYTCRI